MHEQMKGDAAPHTDTGFVGVCCRGGGGCSVGGEGMEIGIQDMWGKWRGEGGGVGGERDENGSCGEWILQRQFPISANDWTV